MRRVNFKDAVLVLLILCSVSLAFNTWTDKKLWPDGYNFFSSIRQKLGFDDKQNYGSLSKEKLAKPKKMVVNYSSKRSVYYEDADGFDELCEMVREIFTGALESENLESLNSSDWFSALKNKSIFVSYPVVYDSLIVADMFGIKKINSDIGSIKEYVIIPDGLDTSHLIVYIKNPIDKKYLKCRTEYDSTRFVAMIEEYAKNPAGSFPYSFELNFDKISDAQKQRAVIGSEVLLSISRSAHDSLYTQNPIVNSMNDFNEDVTDNILKNFGYNTATARKYPESDNCIVYVENYGTVRFYKNGVMQYDAVTNEKGISLLVDNVDDFCEVYTAALSFVSKLWQDVNPNEELNLIVSSDVVDVKSKTFKIVMDYYYDGIKINDEVRLAAGGDVMKNGVELTVSSGKITSYKQLFRLYKNSGEKIYNTSTIEAADMFFADENLSSGGVINDISPVYTFNDKGECMMAWLVKDDKGNTFVLKNKLFLTAQEQTE